MQATGQRVIVKVSDTLEIVLQLWLDLLHQCQLGMNLMAAGIKGGTMCVDSSAGHIYSDNC